MKKESMMKLFKKSAKVLIFIAFVLFLIYWFNFKPYPADHFTVKKCEIKNTVMGTGVLDAKTKAIVSSRISGRIKSIPVDQGDRVKAGQAVVLLDDEELKMQVDLAEAALTTAKATMKKLKYDLDYARAVLDNARKVYNRYSKLIIEKIVSQTDYDKSIENLKVAEANYNRSKSAIEEAEKRIIESQKNVDLRKTQLEYTTIVAPFDGLIVHRARDPGDIVVPGTPVLNLVSTRILWVESWVGETELEKVRKDQPADVIFRSFPDKKISGKVARIAKEVDKETREFIVDVAVENLPLNWAVGQRAEVFIQTDKKSDTLAVPEEYIKWKKNTPGIFVLKDGKAKWVKISKGLQGNGMVEITDGLSSGDVVLKSSDMDHRIYDGCRVYIK
jgi:RND family efflux transporter MFP subunit